MRILERGPLFWAALDVFFLVVLLAAFEFTPHYLWEARPRFVELAEAEHWSEGEYDPARMALDLAGDGGLRAEGEDLTLEELGLRLDAARRAPVALRAHGGTPWRRMTHLLGELRAHGVPCVHVRVRIRNTQREMGLNLWLRETGPLHVKVDAAGTFLLDGCEDAGPDALQRALRTRWGEGRGSVALEAASDATFQQVVTALDAIEAADGWAGVPPFPAPSPEIRRAARLP